MLSKIIIQWLAVRSKFGRDEMHMIQGAGVITGSGSTPTEVSCCEQSENEALENTR